MDNKLANKNKFYIIAGAALLGILIGVFALLLISSGGSSKTSETAINSTAKSSSSSSMEEVATSDAYMAAMGSRLASQPLPVIGQIAIPDVKVNLPIFQGSGDTQILYGAGTTGDNSTIGTGNLALASHHVFYIAGAETQLFSPLTATQTGMMIYMTDKTYVYQYKVDNLFVVQNTDLSVLDPVPGKPVVTLIYCVNFTGPDRAIVRGTLVSKKAFADSGATVQGYFTAPFNQIPADEAAGLE